MASLESIFAALETEYRHDASPGERRCAREALAAVKADAGSCFGVARATLALPPGNDAVAFFGLGCLERVATTFWNGLDGERWPGFVGDVLADGGGDAGARARLALAEVAEDCIDADYNGRLPRRRADVLKALNASALAVVAAVFGVADRAARAGPMAKRRLVAALRCLRHFAAWVSWDGPTWPPRAPATRRPRDRRRAAAGDGAANVAALLCLRALAASPHLDLDASLGVAAAVPRVAAALFAAGAQRELCARFKALGALGGDVAADGRRDAVDGALAPTTRAARPPRRRRGPELLLPAFREAAKLAQARKAYDAEFVDADEYAQHFANMRAGLAQLVAALAELDAPRSALALALAALAAARWRRGAARRGPTRRAGRSWATASSSSASSTSAAATATARRATPSACGAAPAPGGGRRATRGERATLLLVDATRGALPRAGGGAVVAALEHVFAHLRFREPAADPKTRKVRRKAAMTLNRLAEVAPHALALQFDALRDGAARVIASRALCDAARSTPARRRAREIRAKTDPGGAALAASGGGLGTAAGLLRGGQRPRAPRADPASGARRTAGASPRAGPACSTS
ncbi:hypothetical protein JL720_14591 [Aureococcus anophagefferens]|nr:hypothetical protein JL720_14591 [Aureococcus anophagefferens]